MKNVFRRLMQLWAGAPEHNAGRMIESVLPVASLYGMDMLYVDQETFHDRKPR